MRRILVSNPLLSGGSAKAPLTSGRDWHRKHVEAGYNHHLFTFLQFFFTTTTSYVREGLPHAEHSDGKSVTMKVIVNEKVIRVGMMEQLKREISVMKVARSVSPKSAKKGCVKTPLVITAHDN